jgi:hypothetical protein
LVCVHVPILCRRVASFISQWRYLWGEFLPRRNPPVGRWNKKTHHLHLAARRKK